MACLAPQPFLHLRVSTGQWDCIRAAGTKVTIVEQTPLLHLRVSTGQWDCIRAAGTKVTIVEQTEVPGFKARALINFD